MDLGIGRRALTTCWMLVAVLGCGSDPGQPEPPCPSGQSLDLDEICVPEACALGAFAFGSPPPLLWVAPGGEDGASGSRETPLASVQAAIERAGGEGGGVIAIAAGSYSEALRIGRDQDRVELHGRCPEQVDISPPEPSSPALLFGGRRNRVQGIRFHHSEFGVQMVPGDSADAELRLDHLHLHDITGPAITAAGEGAEVQVGDVLIEDIRPTSGNIDGFGVEARSGVRAELSRVTVRRATRRGFSLSATARELTLIDCRAEDTRPGLLDGGRGLVASGAELIVRGLTVRGGSDVGIVLDGDGDAEMSDVRVRDVLRYESNDLGVGVAIIGYRLRGGAMEIDGVVGAGLSLDGGADVELDGLTVRAVAATLGGSLGVGVYVQNGSTITVSDLLIEDFEHQGLRVAGASSRLVVDGARIRGARWAGALEGGAVYVAGGTAMITDLLAEDNEGIGVWVANPGSLVELRDSVVRGGRPGGGITGWGLHAQLGGRLLGERLLLQDNAEFGVTVQGLGSEIELLDSRVLDTRLSSTGDSAAGLQAEDGGLLLGEGLLVSGSARMGLLTPPRFGPEDTAPELRIRGSEIRDGRPDAFGVAGMGAWIGFGHLDLRDSLFSGNIAAGLVLRGAEASAELEDVRIEATRPSLGGAFGRGVEVLDGAQLTAEQLSIDGAWQLGLLAGGGASVDLQGGSISNVHEGLVPGGGFGAVSQGGASLLAVGLRVGDCAGPGLIASGGQLHCSGCEVIGAHFAGAVALGAGLLSLDGGELLDTAPHPARGGGVGIFSWGTGGGARPVVQLSDLLIAGQPGPAIYLRGAADVLVDSALLDVRAAVPALTAAVMVVQGLEPRDGATGLLLQDSRVEGELPHAVLLDGSGARFSGFSAPGVTGSPLWLQNCDEAPPGSLDFAGLPANNGCEGPRLEVDPLLWYTLEITNLGIVP